MIFEHEDIVDQRDGEMEPEELELEGNHSDWTDHETEAERNV